MNQKVLFFGCGSAIGHYLWRPGTYVHWATYAEIQALPWKRIDAQLTPGLRDDYGRVDAKRQIEGHARLHHKDNWTALAWWDFSVDRRSGSNAALFVEGTHTFGEMIKIGKEQFPSFFARFTYEIKVVE